MAEKKNEKNTTFLCTIALRSKTVAQTFLPLFDSANGCFCQERSLKSRNFSTMVTWNHTSSLYCNLSILFYFAFGFFSLVSKLPINIQTNVHLIIWSDHLRITQYGAVLRKKLTHNPTHSTLQSKSKNIENCIYFLAKLDVKISRIDNTDQSCCFLQIFLY